MENIGKKEMTKIYNYAVSELMENDRNGSYDTLLEECGNDLSYAFKVMISCIKRVMEDTEGEEREFYNKIYKKLTFTELT